MIQVFPPLVGPYVYKKNSENLFITFGVITNSDKQPNKYTD